MLTPFCIIHSNALVRFQQQYVLIPDIFRKKKMYFSIHTDNKNETATPMERANFQLDIFSLPLSVLG